MFCWTRQATKGAEISLSTVALFRGGAIQGAPVAGRESCVHAEDAAFLHGSYLGSHAPSLPVQQQEPGLLGRLQC